MSLKAVTFDCAQTLVEVLWNPVQIALDAAESAGIPLDRQVAGEQYMRLFQGRQHDYFEVSQKGFETYDAWWVGLTRDWLTPLGFDQDLDQVVRNANRIIYGSENPAEPALIGEGDQCPGIFVAYPGVRELITSLRQRGLKIGLLSNWDISLHRIVKMHGWADLFDVVIASHEFGAEKPDPRIFLHACNLLGSKPEETLHVGDNPIDDIQGARAAGLHALLVDHDDKGFAEVEATVNALS
jgi:REG-2-like HAD superfamily hydrolase